MRRCDCCCATSWSWLARTWSRGDGTSTSTRCSRRVERRDFWGAFIALYDHVADLEGKTGWVCKDNRVFEFAGELVATTDAKLIYLVRDGRDFALSFFASPAGPKTLTVAASLWMTEQLTCMRMASMFPQRVITTRYEDLVDHPEQELGAICRHIGIDYDERMLSFHESDRARSMAGTSEFWKNLSRPVMKGNHSKWKTKMAPGANLYFQHVAGLALAYHGYEIRDGEVGRLRSAVKPLTDNFIDLSFKLFRRFRRPEASQRRKKAETHGRIVERLKRSTGE